MKLCSKTLKMLIMNWTDQSMSKKLLIPAKSCLFCSILTLKKLKYFVLHDKFALLQGDVLSWELETVSRELLEMFRLCISNTSKLWPKDELLMILMKLRLGFLFSDLSQHFGIYLVVFALNFSVLLLLLLFFQAGETSPPPPSSYAPVGTTLKYIARNFKNLID